MFGVELPAGKGCSDTQVKGAAGTVRMNYKLPKAACPRGLLSLIRTGGAGLVLVCCMSVAACSSLLPFIASKKTSSSSDISSGEIKTPINGKSVSRSSKDAADPEFTNSGSETSGERERGTGGGFHRKGQPGSSTPSSSKGNKATTGDSVETDSTPVRFEKPDHQKYHRRIRKLAEKIVEKQGWDLARLCQEDLTDEWTLTLYTKGRKSFSFLVYTWDPVDDRWEKTFESAARPISTWKSHHRFVVISKHCSILKGRVE